MTPSSLIENGSEISGIGEEPEIQPQGRWWRRSAAVLLWLEPLWIALLAPSLLFREYLWEPWVQPALVAALFLFWPLRLLCDRRLAPATPLNAPIWLLLIWSGLSLWQSPTPDRSWEAIGYFAFGVASFVALLNWPPAQHRPWLVVLLISVLGVALAAMGPALLQTLPEEFVTFSNELSQSQPVQIYGSVETINPNILAGALLVPLPLLLALAIRPQWSRLYWWPLLLLAPAGLILWTLLLAQSRGAYLAALISLLLVLTLRWPWSAAIAGIGAVAAASALSWNGIYHLVESIGSEGDLTSMSGRWEVWERALYALVDFPLTGIGIGAFDLVIPQLYPYVTIGAGSQIPHAHNLLLQVGVDLGLPGLLAYGWLCVAAVQVLIQALRTADLEGAVEVLDHFTRTTRKQRHERRSRRRSWLLHQTLAAGAAGAICALLLHGIVDAALWGTKPAILSWLLFALIALLHLKQQSVSVEDPPTRWRRSKHS